MQLYKNGYFPGLKTNIFVARVINVLIYVIMRTIVLSLSLAVFGPALSAFAQEDRRGVPARIALDRIAMRYGAPLVESIVEMTGRRGQSQPGEWWVVVRDERSRSRLRTMRVEDGRATDEGENKDFYPRVLPLGFIDEKKLKMDSPAVFNILVREATAARIGFDSVDYKLRCREFSNEPVWSLTVRDVRGNIVGKVLLSGLDGRIYRRVWYYRQASGYVKVVDSEIDALRKPEIPDRPKVPGKPDARQSGGVPEFSPGPGDPGTEQAEIEEILPR